MAKNGIQRNLFTSLMEFSASPLAKRYEILFSQLDLSAIKLFNTGVGATGYSRHALIKALVYQRLENIPHIAALCRHLRDHPVVADLCGFDPNDIPDDTVFYKFLKYTPNSVFQRVHQELNKRLKEQGTLSADTMAIDSKPIRANTKENNVKNPQRNTRDKNRKPTADPYAALGFYCASNEYPNKKALHFFWGYRNHAVVDAKSGICLVEITLPANEKDERVATKLLKKLKKLYKPKSGTIVIGDKAYDTKEIFSFIVQNLRGIPIIPENRRNKKQRATDKQGRPICHANIPMAYNGTFSDNNRTRAKFRCPILCSRKTRQTYGNCCPIEHPMFTKGKRYGCTAYITVTEDERALTNRYSNTFRKLYTERQVIEQYFARLQAVGVETPLFFNDKSIANITTIAHIALSAVAAAAVELQKHHKIRSYRTFASP